MAVHASHAEIADNQVGGVVDGFEQGIGAVAGSGDLGQRRERIAQHGQHHRVVIDQQDFHIALHK